MFDYIEQVLSEVDPVLMYGSSLTPATPNLFKITDSSTKLTKKDADVFHQNMARLLFLSKRARPDIQTAVVVLCTRVHSPDVDLIVILRLKQMSIIQTIMIMILSSLLE